MEVIQTQSLFDVADKFKSLKAVAPGCDTLQKFVELFHCVARSKEPPELLKKRSHWRLLRRSHWRLLRRRKNPNPPLQLQLQLPPSLLLR